MVGWGRRIMFVFSPILTTSQFKKNYYLCRLRKAYFVLSRVLWKQLHMGFEPKTFPIIEHSHPRRRHADFIWGLHSELLIVCVLSIVYYCTPLGKKTQMKSTCLLRGWECSRNAKVLGSNPIRFILTCMCSCFHRTRESTSGLHSLPWY